MEKLKNMCIEEIEMCKRKKTNFKDIQIEVYGSLLEAIAGLTGYKTEFLLDRLEECVEEEGINQGIVTFVAISLERDW